MRVFEGRKFSVEVGDIARDDGTTFKGEIVKHPGAVVILGILPDQSVILIKNERFAVNETLWELPAGTLEENEAPLETAKREMIEETGYKVGSIEPLMEFFTSPGFCDEKIFCFIARDLVHVGQQLEETEKITVHPLKLDRVMDMIRSGEIHDCKTIAAILHYERFVNP